MSHEVGELAKLDLPSETLPELAAVIDQYMQVILALRLPLDVEVAIAMLLKVAESPIDRHRARAAKWQKDVGPKLVRDIPAMMASKNPHVRARFGSVIPRLPDYGIVENPIERNELQNEVDALMADVKELLALVEVVQKEASDVFSGMTKDHDAIAKILAVAQKKIGKRKKKVEKTYKQLPVDDAHVNYTPNLLYYRQLFYFDTLNREQNVNVTIKKWNEPFEITLKALSAIGSHWAKVLENLETVAGNIRRSAMTNKLVSVNMRTAQTSWERMMRYFEILN